MANWSVLKAAIANVIKTNGNQEITGALLQNTLTSIVTSVGENATFAGIATQTTNPGVPDGPVFYIADSPGTYSNFSGIHLDDTEIVLLAWKNKWFKRQINVPTNYVIRRINTNIGLPEYPTFRDNKPYKVGDIVVYKDIIYKFILDHVAGPWKGEEAVPYSLKKYNDIRTDELYMRTRTEKIIDLSFNFYRGSFFSRSGDFVGSTTRISSNCFTNADDAWITVSVNEGFKYALYSKIDYTDWESNKKEFKVGSFFIIGLKKDDDSEITLDDLESVGLDIICKGTKKNSEINIESVKKINNFRQRIIFTNDRPYDIKRLSIANINARNISTFILNIPDDVVVSYIFTDNPYILGAGGKKEITSKIIQNDYNQNYLSIQLRMYNGEIRLNKEDISKSYISLIESNLQTYGLQDYLDKSAFIKRAYIGPYGDISLVDDYDLGSIVRTSGIIIKPADSTHFRFNYYYNTNAALIAFYNADNKLISTYTKHKEQKGEIVDSIPENTHHLILASRTSDEFNPKFEFLKIDNSFLNESAFLVEAYIDNSGNQISDSGGALSTDFIKIPLTAKTIKYTGSYTQNNSICVFYNSSKVKMSIIKAADEVMENFNIAIPEGAVYCKLAARGPKLATYKKQVLVKFTDAGGSSLVIQDVSNFVNVKISTRQINYNMPELMHQISKTDAIKEPEKNINWSGWRERRYSFGVDINKIPQPFHIKTQSISEGTIICAGTVDYIRWGFHVFEGYASDGRSRITMLVNKHEEESKKVAELYYYGTVYAHSASSYNWLKLGSDVKNHSFMFDRDNAVFFGKADMRSVIELASINLDSDINTTHKTVHAADMAFEAEQDSVNNAKCIKYLQLKNARDGAMWYDSKNKKVLIKVNGKWHYINLTEANSGDYNVIA